MSNTEIKTPKMDVQVVELYVSQMIAYLQAGLTWYTKDDLGFGSLQAMLKADDQQIEIIRNHPKLKNVVTKAILFKVIDDTTLTEPAAKPQPASTQPVDQKHEEAALVENSAMDAFMSM